MASSVAPATSTVLYKPGVLEGVLRSEGEALTEEWERKLLDHTGKLIEDIGFLLPGAEEALRQFIALIDQTLKHHEELSQELTQKAQHKSERLKTLVENLDEIVSGGRRTSQFSTEILELVKLYPKDRYLSMVLKVVLNCYTAVKSKLGDQVREVGYCRKALGDLMRSFAEPLPERRRRRATCGPPAAPRRLRTRSTPPSRHLSPASNLPSWPSSKRSCTTSSNTSSAALPTSATRLPR